ncbi:hypothetical protein DFH05DRAFT_1561151, partial [Lentinula detonsa]
LCCNYHLQVQISAENFLSLGLTLFISLVPQASYPQRSTDMHLLSSPAHLFSMVLLSIALGVMTMAVPLTVRDTDIGEWQWHSKRLDDGHIVGLVRRHGQEQQSEAKKRPNAKSSKKLDGQECWYLYITQSHSFHAIQEKQLWRLKHVIDEARPSPGLILGSIKYDVYSPSSRHLANLYSKLETITGDSQFEALNAMINFLKTKIPGGLEYTPRPEDPNAWTKIFLAMTDYDQYLKEFPDVPEKDRYQRPPEGTTDAQPAASISGGSKRKFGLTTDQPETAQLETAQPKTAQLETAQPKTAQLETAQPKTAQLETAQLETAQPEKKPKKGDNRMKISNLLALDLGKESFVNVTRYSESAVIIAYPALDTETNVHDFSREVEKSPKGSRKGALVKIGAESLERL